jgi:ribosomal protein S12 methylthiotransferase accessory factor YcaO
MALFRLPNLFGLPCIRCHVYDSSREIECHGSTAVRADHDAAVHAALREAYMQYITYFAGTRDDYRSHVTLKEAHIGYVNARAMLSAPGGAVSIPEPVDFESVAEELDYVVRKARGAGVHNILVANTSPHERYVLKSVKVMVPGLELWFCGAYTPSRYFGERARRTAELVMHESGAHR